MTGKPSGVILRRQRARERERQRIKRISTLKKEIARLQWYLARLDPQLDRKQIVNTHRQLRTLKQQVRYMGGS